jgi:hypothetical protein
MKKLLLVLTLLISSFVLSGCTKKDTSPNSVTGIPTSGQSTQESKQTSNCQPKEISIEGYGDKGKQLSNCFVEYPGEPSRQDKSYYIVEDICGQFTKEFISATLGKTIVKTKAPDHWSLYNCTYYLDDQKYITLVLEYLTIANQKKGNEDMGRTTSEDPKIPMRNMVVYQPDGQLNNIYLVLSDDKFISIHQSSANAFSGDELITFASNVAKEIKNYK